MRILLVLCVLVLCACAPTVFTRDGLTNDQFEQDKAACEYDVAKANPPNQSVCGFGCDPIAQGIFDGINEGSRQRDLMRACFRSKGYREVAR